MFKDTVKLRRAGGHGGAGVVRFDENLRPAGGTGGDGGNVYLQGSESIYDFKRYPNNALYKAENGKPGGPNNQIGSKGDDLIVLVPLTTVVYDSEGNKILEINSHNEKKLLFKGGRGGLGNGYFRGKGASRKEETTEAKEGESMKVRLELELNSDVIFIGLPNVGKSSILGELTNADAKVAHYAFTTIDPQLGRMDGVTLMDLPGLIEGTYDGKGVGTSFAKHTRRTKIVAHFLSAESPDIIADYKLIRTELENIDPELAAKPEIIVISKSDAKTKKELTDLKKLFKKKEVQFVSIINDDQQLELRKAFKEHAKA